MRAIGEVVAISIDGKPSVYGRIEGYEPDRRPRWYQVNILLLTFPPQNLTWILREEQIDGEAFTMDGVPVEIQAVPGRQPAPVSGEEKSLRPGVVISLAARAGRKTTGDT
jgi:hypothetical protein